MRAPAAEGEISITQESHDNQGEGVPLKWACTNCGYHVEGELPEKCPECGEDREGYADPYWLGEFLVAEWIPSGATNPR